MQLLRFLYITLFFILPFSVENSKWGFGVNLPSEPIEISIAFILLFFWRQVYDSIKQIRTNPLFISIAGYIIWSWISCAYSDMPMVSIKYTIIETLHWVVFVAGYSLLQRNDSAFFKQCIFVYTLSFIPLLIRGLYLHAQYNFVIDFSAASMRPFYRDHPLYGSVLAFLIPFWIYFYYRPTSIAPLLINRKVVTAILSLLTVCLFFSFSRAAWLTFLVGGVSSSILYHFRNQSRKLIIIFFSGTILLVLVAILIAGVAQKKEYVKSKSVYRQLLSSFNWTYDVANLERLNRYKCAWRMFEEKPFTGFGNNMYKFRYLAFQKSEDMTRISLNEALPNARTGTGGNSHSDYLAALTELGLPGFIFWCGIVCSAIWLSCQIFLKQRELSFLFIFFSLFTFYAHVLVNNFVHEEKIASLMWVCCSVILTRKSSE